MPLGNIRWLSKSCIITTNLHIDTRTQHMDLFLTSMHTHPLHTLPRTMFQLDIAILAIISCTFPLVSHVITNKTIIRGKATTFLERKIYMDRSFSTNMIEVYMTLPQFCHHVGDCITLLHGLKLYTALVISFIVTLITYAEVIH